MTTRKVAVIVPFYQRERGILTSAIESVVNQTTDELVEIIVVDDGSPTPAVSETEVFAGSNISLKLIQQKNGGAGAARNRGLDNIAAGTEYVAFLDSDDKWSPGHLENAISALDSGYDFYFSDYIACNDRDETNFERIGSLDAEEHRLVDVDLQLHELNGGAIDHIIRQGNVIGTSNVVYRYSSFSTLRFREEFYNGQDFFFWMDLDQLGAKIAFSRRLGCDCGSGINIYSGAGWGSDRSLQRLRNEIKVWAAAEKIYSLSPKQAKANDSKLRGLENTVVRDVFHRLARGRGIDMKLIRDVARLRPGFYRRAGGSAAVLVKEKLGL